MLELRLILIVLSKHIAYTNYDLTASVGVYAGRLWQLCRKIRKKILSLR